MGRVEDMREDYRGGRLYEQLEFMEGLIYFEIRMCGRYSKELSGVGVNQPKVTV